MNAAAEEVLRAGMRIEAEFFRLHARHPELSYEEKGRLEQAISLFASGWPDASIQILDDQEAWRDSRHREEIHSLTLKKLEQMYLRADAKFRCGKATAESTILNEIPESAKDLN
jgi:hypothetical protein